MCLLKKNLEFSSRGMPQSGNTAHFQSNFGIGFNITVSRLNYSYSGVFRISQRGAPTPLPLPLPLHPLSLPPFLPPSPFPPSPPSLPLPTSPPFLPSLALPTSHPRPPLPFPLLPLEVGPLKSLNLGDRCKLPQRGLGRSRSRNRF